MVWSQATVDSPSGQINGPSVIYIAVSTNHGKTWGTPVQVSAAAPTLSNGTNLFVWVAAGDPGRVDIVWYGTSTLGACPNQPCGSGAITGDWQVMMAQSLNAIVNGSPNPNPSFNVTQVSEVSNHYGAICTFGIACTTGGDRGLLDFISVTVGLQGEANVVWADAVNRNSVMGTPSALIAFSRQVAGPSLYANIGQVNGPAPATGAGAGSPEALYSGDNSSSARSTLTALRANGRSLLTDERSIRNPRCQMSQSTLHCEALACCCQGGRTGANHRAV